MVSQDAELHRLELDLRKAEALWTAPDDEGRKAFDTALNAMADTPAETLAGALVKARYIWERQTRDSDYGCLEISRSLLADLYRMAGAS